MLGRSEVAVAQLVEPRVVVPVVVGSNPIGHPRFTLRLPSPYISGGGALLDGKTLFPFIANHE